MTRKQQHYKWRLVGNVILTLVMFTAISVILKPVFMFYNHSSFSDCTLTDYMAVIWHGLPMDLSVAGYFTIIPALLALISIWLNPTLIRGLHRTYLFFCSARVECNLLHRCHSLRLLALPNRLHALFLLLQFSKRRASVCFNVVDCVRRRDATHPHIRAILHSGENFRKASREQRHCQRQAHCIRHYDCYVGIVVHSHSWKLRNFNHEPR